MDVLAATGLSLSLSALALWKKALTPGGLLLACVMCIAITSIGGLAAFSVLTVTLAGTVAADRIAGNRADPSGVRRKSGSRDARRVFCNVGIGTIALLLYGWRRDPVFEISYYAVMAESLADSLASKLGPMSEEVPRDIWTGKEIPKGLSGGVTRWGTFSEVIGAAAVAGTMMIWIPSVKTGMLVLVAGFLGAVCDSLFGSRLQVKYRCTRCGCITERESHCNTRTEKISGIRWISNDAVNLMSNITAMILAVLLFRL